MGNESLLTTDENSTESRDDEVITVGNTNEEDNQTDESTDESKLTDETNESDENVETKADSSDETDESDDDDNEDGQPIVSIEGEKKDTTDDDEGTPAPKWVKKLRKDHREVTRKYRELQKKHDAVSESVPEPIELGSKPTMDDSDVDFDPVKYEEKFEKWMERKQVIKKQTDKVEVEKKKAGEQLETRMRTYTKQVIDMGANDYKDMAVTVESKLTETQQSLILESVDNAANVIYALGKRPQILEELKGKSHARFIAGIAKFESKLKITTKKRAATPPEKKMQGSTKVETKKKDKRLEEMNKHASLSGNFTEVIKYREKLREEAREKK